MDAITTERMSCAQHGPYDVKTVDIEGYQFGSRVCPVCEREKRQRRDEQAKKMRLLQNRQGAGIPKRFIDKSLADYIAETPEQQLALKMCKRYVEVLQDRVEHGGGLMLCGKPGTGKTHLSCALVSAAIDAGYTARYETALSLNEAIKATYGGDSDYSEAAVAHRLTSYDLLVIDEIGASFGSNVEAVNLFKIINARYNDVKPTIICSNLTVEELGKYISDRGVDRLRDAGGAIIEFAWDSFRGKKQ